MRTPDLPSIEDLRGKSALELESLRDDLDAHLRSLHKAPDGSIRDKTPHEQDQFDELMLVREAVDRRLEQHARAANAFRDKPKAVQTAFGGTLSGTNEDVDPGQVLRMHPTEARDAALRTVEQRGQVLPEDAKDEMDRLLRSVITPDTPNLDGGYIAKRTLITESDAYRSGWRQAVTQEHPVLTDEEARALRSLIELDRHEFRAMNEGTPSAGGYGVPVFIDPTIVMTAQGSANPFMRISRVETVTTKAWKGVSSAGVTWSWDAEASVVSDDSPVLAQPQVDVHMARGFVPFSIEVGQDYPGFAEEMARILAEGYDELTAQAFAAGSGSGQPRGILTALDANTNVEVVVTTDGQFGGVDINKVWGALPDRWKSRATWLMSYDAGNEVATFGNSNNLSFVTVDLTNVVQTLRQRPVEYSSYMPDFTGATTAANILIVGDFSNYLIARRAGMSVELVPHLFQQQTAGTGVGMPTGQRGWFAFARTGGNSINDLGFRLLQNQ